MYCQVSLYSGIESQGMILTAEQTDGKLILVNPDALTQNGSTVR